MLQDRFEILCEIERESCQMLQESLNENCKKQKEIGKLSENCKIVSRKLKESKKKIERGLKEY